MAALRSLHDAIELEKGETIHDATQRIERTKRVIATHKGRYIAVTMKVEQRDRHMVAAYAPAIPADRPTFLRSLTNKLKKTTVLGIDANCVPDVLLDRKSQAASQYNNTGADTLNQVVASLGLLAPS